MSNLTVESLKKYGISERTIRELVEKGSRDVEDVRKVLQLK